jgi:hypothetical protein
LFLHYLISDPVEFMTTVLPSLADLCGLQKKSAPGVVDKLGNYRLASHNGTCTVHCIT